jgi:alpha-beta hydrolase superfamily lysophospholipase
MNKGASYPDSSFDFSMSVSAGSDSIDFGEARIFDDYLNYVASTGDTLHMELWYPWQQSIDFSKVIVLVPAYGERTLSLYPLAIDCIKHGTVVAIVSPRGVDYNESVPSDFAILEYNDVRDAVAAYVKQKHITRPRFAVFGSSIGSIVALNLAARLPEVKAVVLESPMVDPLATSKVLLSGSDERALQVATNRNKNTVDTLLPTYTLSAYRISKPVKVIWGANDKVVPRNERDRFHSLLAQDSSNATFEEIQGAGHVLRYGFPLPGNQARALNDSIIVFLVNSLR